MTFWNQFKDRLSALTNNADTPFFALLAANARTNVVDTDFRRPAVNKVDFKQAA